MSKSLDNIDALMIATLRENARTPLVTLAKKIGLSRSAAQERLRRLEQHGIIAGYTIRFNPPSPEVFQAWLWIKYIGGRRCNVVVPALLRFPEVRYCNSLAGPIDLLVLVETATPNDLYQLREKISEIEGILEVTTAPVLEVHYDGRGGAK